MSNKRRSYPTSSKFEQQNIASVYGTVSTHSKVEQESLLLKGPVLLHPRLSKKRLFCQGPVPLNPSLSQKNIYIFRSCSTQFKFEQKSLHVGFSLQGFRLLARAYVAQGAEARQHRKGEEEEIEVDGEDLDVRGRVEPGRAFCKGLPRTAAAKNVAMITNPL